MSNEQWARCEDWTDPRLPLETLANRACCNCCRDTEREGESRCMYANRLPVVKSLQEHLLPKTFWFFRPDTHDPPSSPPTFLPWASKPSTFPSRWNLTVRVWSPAVYPLCEWCPPDKLEGLLRLFLVWKSSLETKACRRLPVKSFSSY